MSTKVVIEVDDTNQVSNFLKQLRERDLINDRDFTWMYEPLKHDQNYNIVHGKRVTFFFKEGKDATWFTLTH